MATVTQSGGVARRDANAYRFIPELDAVRGIAVLLVLLCHSYIIQPMPQGIPFLKDLFDLGWSGVDLFFVLSGFLISGILLDTKDSKNYFSSFYARRVLRIFPLYFLCVIGYFHVILPVAHHFGKWLLLDNSLELWFWLYLSNWKLAFSQSETTNFLQHFWSLAIEEQFYMFWPLVVFFTGRRWLPYVCLTMIGVSFALRCIYAQNHFGTLFLYYLTPFRVEPLAFGSLAAVLVRNASALSILRNGRLLCGIAAGGLFMLLATLLTGRTTNVAGPPMAIFGFTSFAVIYTCLVLYAYIFSGSPVWLAAQLRKPVLRSFGKYSYAIYVFHYPLFIAYSKPVQIVSAALPEQVRFIFWLLALAIGIGLSYGVALASWNLMEKHFWELKRRFAVRY
jgi:peptidoglycan/LPS O-acetylase OafA/YrhL